jgi:hypothetical protein
MNAAPAVGVHPPSAAAAAAGAAAAAARPAEAEFDGNDGEDLVPVLSSVLQQLVHRDDKVTPTPPRCQVAWVVVSVLRL